MKSITRTYGLNRVLPSLVAAGVLISPSANAFWGIGDVTFDPTNYGINAQSLANMKQMYDTAMKQFDRLDKMQSAIARASEAYDRLTNLDLHSMADGLNPGMYMKNARGLQGISAARSELQRLKGNSTGDVYYINDQLSRLDDLEKMVGLQGVAAKNAKVASTDLDQRKSSQIVAQSTSVMAALATAEEQRRQKQDLADAQAQKDASDLTHKSLELYQSLSASK